MTSSRPLAFAAAVGSVVLLIAVVFTLWPADPTDYTLTSGHDQADGETVGWVSKVEANTIHVNSGPFGGGVVPLVVTRSTRITVGSKEGWFEDIRPGGQVKVSYEVYNGKRLARTVELLVDEGARRPVQSQPRLKSAADPAGAERVPTKASASNPAPAARPAPAAKSAEPAPAATPQPPSDARPVARPETTRTQAADGGPSRTPPPAPARSSSPTESAPRAQETPRPAAPTAPRPAEPPRTPDGSGTTDGSEAVDWLLKSRH